MELTIKRNNYLDNTIREMYRIINSYYMDLAEYGTMDILSFYKLVKNIPYRKDLVNGKVTEVLKRPSYTMARYGIGGDCDDKAIVMGAFAKLKNIPFRIAVVGTKKAKKFFHVMVQYFLNGKWIPIDATYSFNTFGHTLRHYDKVKIYE